MSRTTPKRGTLPRGTTRAVVAPGRSPVDPWTATFEEWLASFRLDEEISAAQLQWVRARAIASRREKIEQGSGSDVLQAVADCVLHGLSIPEWLAHVFLKRHRTVTSHQVKSWDAEEAFGRPYPKSVQLKRLRKDAGAGPLIYAYVRKLLQQDPARAIDESLFDDVAAHFAKVPGLGRSECQRIYRQAAKELDPLYGTARVNFPKIAVIRGKR